MQNAMRMRHRRSSVTAKRLKRPLQCTADLSMTWPWSEHEPVSPKPARSLTILFARWRRVLCGKSRHFVHRLKAYSFSKSPNSAPATKSDKPTLRSSAHVFFFLYILLFLFSVLNFSFCSFSSFTTFLYFSYLIYVSFFFGSLFLTTFMFFFHTCLSLYLFIVDYADPNLIADHPYLNSRNPT